MKVFKTMIGACIAGMIVMSVWGAFTKSYGLVGGWFASLIIIGTMWFMNHYIGLIDNEADGAWVDMALGIAITGTMRDVFLAGTITPLINALPTLVFVVIGGTIGGACAALIEKNMAQKAKNKMLEL